MPTAAAVATVRISGADKSVKQGAPISLQYAGKPVIVKWNLTETVSQLQAKIDAAERGEATVCATRPPHASRARSSMRVITCCHCMRQAPSKRHRELKAIDASSRAAASPGKSHIQSEFEV